jgi:eukaryotic-like serine/threonine-protein kinase
MDSLLVTDSPPSTRSLASVPLDSEGARELLQQRLALFARIIVLFGVVIQALVRWVAFRMGGTPFAVNIDWTPNVHLLVLLGGVALWWRARNGRRSLRELLWLDVACLVLPVTFSSFALWDAQPVVRPNLIHVLGTGYLLVLRAVLVPSTGRRTGLIGLLFGGGVMAWTYAYYARPGMADIAPPILFTMSTAVWVSMAVTIASVASHTIFGLRRRVREATQMGQYLLIRKIGQGGMGVVFEASHALLRRRTALKLLPISNAGEHNVARFEREVRLTSTLTHPNTVAIYDYGRSPDGVFYYAMEYLDGVDLQKLVDRFGAQPSGVVEHILEQVCGALSEAHAAGLIHRDIKPANVILCERGGTPAVAKVVDFGLVKAIRAGDESLAETNARGLVGTPLYMSPESITQPDQVDGRSDLYAVGALGYFLVTGQHVFTGATSVEVCAHHLHTAPVPPGRRGAARVDPELEVLLLQCLAKDREQRPDSAHALGERLAAVRASSGLDAAAVRAWWEQIRAQPAGPDPESPSGAGAPSPHGTTVLNIDLHAR